MDFVAIALLVLLSISGSLLMAWWRGVFSPGTWFGLTAKGLAVGFGILTTAYLLLLFGIALKYRGRCPPGWGGDLGSPCPFLEYFGKEAGFMTFIFTFGAWQYMLGFLLFCVLAIHVIAAIKSVARKNRNYDV